MWFIDSSGKLRRALTDSLGHIQVDVLTSPLSALIGEVQASPTTYTVLDRLKTLATLLAAGLPTALDTGALKVHEQSPITSLNIGNWPSDYPDAGVAKLLGGGLPSGLTSDKLKVRASEIETLLGAGLPLALDTLALKVREQNPLTEIDVDVAKILGTAVSLTNYLPIGVVYPAGTLIDPRSIRYLTSTDVVTVVQATASSHKVEINQPTTKETFHVDTSGGTNIVLDKLKVEAYTERRSVLSNDGTLTAWGNAFSPHVEGKFYPRGCRGFIDTISIYCKDLLTAGGTITVYLAPYIGAGAVMSAAITVPEAGPEAWRDATFGKIWEYDSMFVWVFCSSVWMKFGQDATEPFDLYYSEDAGVTWATASYRNYFRVNLKGQTVSDLTFSGTADVVVLPASSSVSSTTGAAIANGETKTLATITGSGVSLLISVRATHDNVLFYIVIDGAEVYANTLRALANDWFLGTATPGNTMLKFTTDGVCVIQITLPFQFRREIRLDVKNQSGVAVTADGNIFANTIK